MHAASHTSRDAMQMCRPSSSPCDHSCVCSVQTYSAQLFAASSVSPPWHPWSQLACGIYAHAAAAAISMLSCSAAACPQAQAAAQAAAQAHHLSCRAVRATAVLRAKPRLARPAQPRAGWSLSGCCRQFRQGGGPGGRGEKGPRESCVHVHVSISSLTRPRASVHMHEGRCAGMGCAYDCVAGRRKGVHTLRVGAGHSLKCALRTHTSTARGAAPQNKALL